MNKNSNEIRKVPNLRFPGFNGEWRAKFLSELMTFKNGLNASKEDYGQGYKFINVLDIINNDFLKHDRIIGSVNVSETDFKKNIVEYGDILFQRSSETREEVGQANVYVDKDTPATFGGFVIRGKKKSEYNPVFLNYLLKTACARKEITSKSGGSTRYNVGQDTLSSVRINMACLIEQTKIANFLTIIDARIQTQNKILEDYKLLKKGLMQKIFKQEIRFKDEDGKEFPKWEKSRLGSFLRHKSFRNKNLQTNTVLSVSNLRGFILQSDQFDNHRVASKDVSNYKIVQKNDVAYNPSRINVGSIAILKDFETGIVSPMYVIFSLKNTLDLTFFENLISTHLFKHLVKIGCSGSVRDSLNFEDLESFKLNFPCIEEQQKIATTLSAIDKKIALEEDYLDKLQAQKKYLLQNMFI